MLTTDNLKTNLFNTLTSGQVTKDTSKLIGKILELEDPHLKVNQVVDIAMRMAEYIDSLNSNDGTPNTNRHPTLGS